MLREYGDGESRLCHQNWSSVNTNTPSTGSMEWFCLINERAQSVSANCPTAIVNKARNAKGLLLLFPISHITIITMHSTMPLLLSSRRQCSLLSLILMLLRMKSISSVEVPQLDGQHFKITAVQEAGFLDITDDETTSSVQFSGYLIDMLQALSSRANFTYDLLAPSGFGSSCSPRLANSAISSIAPYDARFRTQYRCGADDVMDDSIPSNWKHNVTDMYLGLFYVTPSRQLSNQFTMPFMPPTSGTLAMFGTATHVIGFPELAAEIAAGKRTHACGPAGTDLLSYVETAYPGMKVKGILGGEDEIYAAFDSGECEIYIVDGPIAKQMVLRYSQRGRCLANGKKIGMIGNPMEFGLSHYAIGIRADIPTKVASTLSYWLTILMSCSPTDANGECPEGNLATFYDGKGGIGTECGYVQSPGEQSKMHTGTIIGFSMLSLPVLLLFGFGFHWMRLKRRHRKASREHAQADAQAIRERQMNAFIATEVQRPLSVAKAALEDVYGSRALDMKQQHKQNQIAFVRRKLDTIMSSLESIGALVGGLGRDRPQESAPGEMKRFDQVLERFSSHRSLDCSLDDLKLSKEFWKEEK